MVASRIATVQLPNVPAEDELMRRLQEQGVVVLNGALDQAGADRAIVQLLAMDLDRDGDADRPIAMRANGITGSVGAALAMYDVMRSLTTPVHVVAGGLLDTAGALVVAAGTNGHRRLLPTARVHLRRPTEPTIPGLPLESAAQEVEHLRERATEVLGVAVHPPRLLSAEEAVEAGIADLVE
jgi:ATP-dependent Clp protease protease subunit